MRYRIRSAAIIVNESNAVLLVLHKNPTTGETWWTPPGGGMENGENAVEAVVREVKEECGIDCKPGKLVYVREFVAGQNKDVHHIEFYFIAGIESYDLITGIDPELEEQYIVESRFLSREEIEQTEISVYPEELRNRFWDDLEREFAEQNVYLGFHRQGDPE